MDETNDIADNRSMVSSLSQATDDPPARTSEHANSPNHDESSQVTLLARNPEQKLDFQSTKAPRPSRWKRFIFDTWLPEVAMISMSAVLLIAIAAVLEAYDSNPMPKLPYGLTLNAIISILATLSKSCLISVVASAISQLKWCWIQSRRRTLRDLQLFDDASRGPLGSLAMLFEVRTWSFTTIGALIILVATLFDPFVQQILTSPGRWTSRPSDSAVAPRAMKFPVDNQLDLMPTINSGVYSNTGQFERDPTCPSGNCDWPPFESVGWCSKCINATSLASLSGCDLKFNKTDLSDRPCSVGLGYGDSFNFTIKASANPFGGYILSFPTEAIWGMNGVFDEDTYPLFDLGFQHEPLGVGSPVLVLGHVSLQFGNNVTAGRTAGIPDPNQGVRVGSATQCAISLCSQSYSISVHDGITSTKKDSLNWGKFYIDKLGGEEPVIWSPYGGNLNMTKTHEGIEDTERLAFGPIPRYWDPLVATLAGTGDVQLSWQHTNPADNRSALHWVELDGGGMTGPVKFPSKELETIFKTNLTFVAASVAASLTALGLDMGNSSVSGTVSSEQIFASVRWEWIILPVLLVASGLLFLVVTMSLSRHRGVRLWKSSLLALLYHGFEEPCSIPVAEDVSGMETAARSTTTRLRDSASGRSVLGT
ncbi:hypothetical protein NA57DRAFT_70423 [Rhizodiscina lignyota]|uniref:Uncharacterized protein n=1 Tax=Rhizodiscina lignyota TaxID=1504668 RepID=A0A9P4ITW9_9PEZI|nr:hypothetical protein NA57DRAFT_70423 [Rhizodiscina lignyota]